MNESSDKRQKSDRRGGDRRKQNIPVKVDRRKAPDRRTQADRRKSSE